jgi:hypothetical protein
MVARTAYTQLRYSPLLLAATLAGWLRPISRLLFAIIGTPTWAVVTPVLMMLAFSPILRFYRLSPLWGAALPLIAATYSAFMLSSAYEHWRGRGGTWKGRSQAFPAKQ